MDCVADVTKLVASLRQQSFHLFPHTYNVILIAPQVFPQVIPYLPKLAMNVDKMAPLLGKTLEHKGENIEAVCHRSLTFYVGFEFDCMQYV